MSIKFIEDMKPPLKRLYASILKIKIKKFLMTDGFKHICLEHDVNKEWEISGQYVRNQYSAAILFPGFYDEETLAIFLSRLLNSRREEFLSILDAIIIGFIKLSGRKLDLSEISDRLVDLDFKIDEVKILEMFELNKRTQRVEEKKESSDVDNKNLTIIENLCEKFHIFVKQLNHRYDKRSGIEIKDEYDVQDILHALLKMFFDDVRPEEWTPNYAGGSSRMDFLLKGEGTVIEAKMARKGRTEKIIGDELIIDIDRYKKHSECNTFVCLVYDPEGVIQNPIGFERDLSGRDGDFLKIIFVVRK